MSSSFSYERYDRRTTSRSNRGLFTYWIPVVTVVTIAAGGLAAWVWSARSDHESSAPSDDENLSYGEESRRDAGPRPPSYGVSEGVVKEEDKSTTYTSYQEGQQQQQVGIGGYVQGAVRNISGVVRRTPSPQQMFDQASKRVAAGVAAAGAMVGGALSAIREEGGNDYEDHDRWSQEADRRNVTATSAESQTVIDTDTRSLREGSSPSQYAGKRKTVAVVVSAESTIDSLHEDPSSTDYHTEQATLLSQLPPIDSSKSNLIILIYNPSAADVPSTTQPQTTGPGNSAAARPPSSQAGSLGSSYAQLSNPAQTSADDLQSTDPQPYTPESARTPALSARDSHLDLYQRLYDQAVRLVEKPANVLTFSTPQGYVHMLKHVAPDLVYVVDSLSGVNGANIDAVRRGVGQVVIVVGGEGTGLGGLIDTEDEGEEKGAGAGRTERWWENSDMIGLGKGVEIVDGAKLTEDFERRVAGRE